MIDLSNKTVLVFGGTSGIGLAAAADFAERGASVTVVSRNPDRAGELPAGVEAAACDVLDRTAMAELLAAHAPIDVLVSSATGGDRAIGPFAEMDMDGFAGSFDKLWGYANVVRYGVEHVADDGAIVLVSGSPARRTKPGQASLGAVGAAVEQLVRTVAAEIAPKRINVVSPGLIDTPMVALEGEARESMYASATAKHPIPRAGRAEEVAQAIVFAATNGFATGTTVDVDGGWLIS